MSGINVGGATPPPGWLEPTLKEAQEMRNQANDPKDQIGDLLKLLKSGQLNPKDPGDRKEIAVLEGAISKDLKQLQSLVQKSGIGGIIGQWVKDASDDWNAAIAGGPGAPVSDIEALMSDAFNQLGKMTK